MAMRDKYRVEVHGGILTEEMHYKAAALYVAKIVENTDPRQSIPGITVWTGGVEMLENTSYDTMRIGDVDCYDISSRDVKAHIKYIKRAYENAVTSRAALLAVSCYPPSRQ